MAAPGGDQVRVLVLAFVARAEQVAQQPVRPAAAADDPADHRRRRALRRGLTAIVASSSCSTFSQTRTATRSIAALTRPVECIVATT